MHKKILKSFLDLADYYSNYIYNHIDASQIPDFQLYDMTVKLLIIYKTIFKYLECQLSAEYNCLRTTNL